MAGTEGPAPARRRTKARGASRTTRRRLDGLSRRIIDDLGAIARDKGHTLRREVDDLVDARKQVAADGLADLSEALRQASHLLSERGRTSLAGFGHAGADRIDEAAATLRARNLGRLIEDVERLARRDPVLLATGAAGLGFLLVRMLRGTSVA